MLVGASGCLFPCEGEGVFPQPAQLVAGGGKIPAGAEEGGKKWVGGVGAEEEGMREAGHVLWRESCGERRRDGKGLGVKLELLHSGDDHLHKRKMIGIYSYYLHISL